MSSNILKNFNNIVSNTINTMSQLYVWYRVLTAEDLTPHADSSVYNSSVCILVKFLSCDFSHVHIHFHSDSKHFAMFPKGSTQGGK